MKAPYRWLKDYVATDLSAKDFADKMIMTGNGVEDIIDLSENCRNVVVGKIVKLEKHPDADKLQICQIDIGQAEPVQIVTGATNVFEGALVPAALHDSYLPNGVHIKKGKLRGVDSFGMLCSGEELCLTEADYPGAGVYGIMILQGEWKPGTDINEVIMTDDTVLDFEIGANRPDCLSVLGLAKEAAAALNVKPVLPEPAFPVSSEDINTYLTVDILDKDLCPRYMARMVKNVKIAPSPVWMQQRLKAAGMRPINNIVDITNFVMLETGQPMHAFDYEDIRGKKIVVRRAEEGEKIITLDGKERDLTTSMLMIADGEGSIGIAGVMGGENSEIKENTQTIVFESAKFMYGNIRQTSRALGLSTEASMRFSKGVDAANSDYALKRACQLVSELGAGEICGGVIDVLSEDISEKHIDVTVNDINTLLGTALDEKTITDCLERVLIRTKKNGKTIRCFIPHFRGDMDGKADIAEEVARIYGYDNIPVNQPSGRFMNTGDPKIIARDILKYYIVGQGYDECISYSFTGTAVWDKLGLPEDSELRRAVKIMNPLGDDTGYMRTTLLGDMLTMLATNLKRKNKNIRLFELNKVFLPESVPATELPAEKQHLCLGGSGNMDFFDMKGVIENILGVRRIVRDIQFKVGGGDYFHPGRKAEIFVEGHRIGEMGEIHPDVADAFGIHGRAYAAELDVDAVFAIAGKKLRFTSLPKFPAIERDIALIVDKNAEAGVIADFISRRGGRFLENVELFDVYTGTGIAEGKKSLAYSLTYRSMESTLTDADINIEKLLKSLEAEFGATLRE